MRLQRRTAPVRAEQSRAMQSVVRPPVTGGRFLEASATMSSGGGSWRPRRPCPPGEGPRARERSETGEVSVKIIGFVSLTSRVVFNSERCTCAIHVDSGGSRIGTACDLVQGGWGIYSSSLR